MAKYSLKAQSVILLRQMLQLPGWAKDIETIYKGGRLLADVVPEIAPGTPVKDLVEFEMDGPNRDLCKVAIQNALSKEAVPAGEWMDGILEAFEFVSKPKPAAPAALPPA